MKHCPRCNVDVKTNRKTCPLCYGVLEHKHDDDIPLQEYPVKATRKHLNLLEKIFLLISFVVIIASIVVNYSTFYLYNHLWSILVVFAVPYLWLLVRYVILGKGFLTSRIFYASITTSIIVFITEWSVCVINKVNDIDMFWSLNYVLPFIIIGAMVSIIVVCSVFRNLYIDSIIYLFMLILLSILIFVLCKVTNLFVIEWPSLACASAGVVLFIGMLIFFNKDTVSELKKRFHLK